jgi:hypothetical protein
MRRHPYLRAYMAGVLLPSWFLLIALTGYMLGHMTGHIPAGLERAIIFPMAVVPNVRGLWNVLYLILPVRRRLSTGAFGALLPVLLFPAGIALTTLLDLRFYAVGRGAAALPAVIAIYYVAWNYGVGSLNRIMDLR